MHIFKKEFVYLHANFQVCSVIFGRDINGGEADPPPPTDFRWWKSSGQIGLIAQFKTQNITDPTTSGLIRVPGLDFAVTINPPGGWGYGDVPPIRLAFSRTSSPRGYFHELYLNMFSRRVVRVWNIGRHTPITVRICLVNLSVPMTTTQLSYLPGYLGDSRI